MLETQFIETVKICSPEDYLVIYVNKFDDETLDNADNLSKNISQTYPALNYIFVSNYDAMETNVLSLEKSIKVLEKRLEEMKKCAKKVKRLKVKYIRAYQREHSWVKLDTVKPLYGKLMLTAYILLILFFTLTGIFMVF